jgi:hypothetical protein
MTDASMHRAGSAAGELHFTDLLGRGYEVLSRDFLHYFWLTLIANLPFLLLYQTVHAGHGAFAWFIVPFLFALVPWALAQAFVVYNVYQDMRGRPPHAGESLKLAFERFLPILILSIFEAFAIGFGYMLLIIPGLLMTALLFVATPVCVVEKLSPIRSMWRSADLTKGHRWQMVGLFVLLMIIDIVVGTIIGVVFGLAGVIVAALAVWVWRAAFGAFFAVTVVVAYHQLRVVKEGASAEPIGAELDAQLAG